MNSVDRNSVRIGRHQAARGQCSGARVCKYRRGFMCVKAKSEEESDLPHSFGHFLTSHLPRSPRWIRERSNLSLPPFPLLNLSPLCGCPIPPSLSLSPSPSVLSPFPLPPSLNHRSPLPSSPNSPGFFTLSFHVATLVFTHLKKNKNLLQEIPSALLSDPLNLAGLHILETSF